MFVERSEKSMRLDHLVSFNGIILYFQRTCVFRFYIWSFDSHTMSIVFLFAINFIFDHYKRRRTRIPLRQWQRRCAHIFNSFWIGYVNLMLKLRLLLLLFLDLCFFIGIHIFVIWVHFLCFFFLFSVLISFNIDQSMLHIFVLVFFALALAFFIVSSCINELNLGCCHWQWYNRCWFFLSLCLATHWMRLWCKIVLLIQRSGSRTLTSSSVRKRMIEHELRFNSNWN